MNTTVDLETKQLLCNKGWRYELDTEDQKVTNLLAEQRWNEGDLSYVDIIIAEVVMWLYEKYGIWCDVGCSSNESFYLMVTNKKGDIQFNDKCFSSPTEAYESAIKFILNNLL